MVDSKRKRRDDGRRGREKWKKHSKKQKSSDSRAQLKNSGRRKKSGPRLPSSLQKEIEHLNPTAALNSDEDIASDDYNEEGEIYGKDVYEFDEERAEEESQKNKRYDRVGVDKFEDELPDELSDDFKDEDLESDDENVDDNDDWGTKDENAMSDDSEEEDDGMHTRMLQGITGMTSEAFEEKRKKKKDDVIPELYPESEYSRAEKLHTKALPYPFTSQEVFDQSLRMPIGPEFNPATTAGALNRPEVVKRPGVIRKPIEFEDPLEKTGRGGEKPKLINKGNGGKTTKKTD